MPTSYWSGVEKPQSQLPAAAAAAWDQSNILQQAGLLASPVPVLGDALGLMGDLKMFYDEPDQRTPFNYGLSLMGLLPFVPSVAGMTSKKLTNADHLRAQMNAALPVEKGGLGLPPDNTAMERAKAMGFNTDLDLYHGTGQDFTEFKLPDPANRSSTRDRVGELAISLAESAELANVFANRSGYDGSNVIPVFHRMSKGAGVNLPGGVSNQEVYDTVSEAFDDGPFDALRFSNYNIPEIKNQRFYMVKNPNQVRSRFAAFDPFKKNSANLLAGGLLGSIGLDQAMQQSQTQ